MNTADRTFTDRLRRLCSVVVAEASTPGEVVTATHDLYALLVAASGLQPEEFDPVVAVETRLPYGSAISPMEAGHCVFDFSRTRMFALAVIDAIAERRRRDTTRPVHVLYAGCGPFATLLLPALHRFGPDDVVCSLIDIHERSLDGLSAVVAAAGFGPFIRSVELADATSYVIPDESPVDVIVIECLLRGLSREPQVAITWNLLDQAGPDVILIPEEIRLELVCIDAEEMSRVPQAEMVRVVDEPAFVLDADTVRGWGPMDRQRETLPVRQARATRPWSSSEVLALATTIRTRDDLTVTDYESGLTAPHLIDGPASAAAGADVRFRYDLTIPGLDVRTP